MIHWLAALALFSLAFGLIPWTFAKSIEAIVKHVTKR
jgi:hypothetical protein